MRTVTLMLILSLSIMMIASSAIATIIRVPEDQLTIQAGIDAAAEGDTVLLTSSNPYVGEGNVDLVIDQVNLVLLGELGADETTIDCECSPSTVGIEISGGLGAGTIVQGITVVCAVGGNGGGIRIHDASPTIKECVLRDNVATMNGAGLWSGYGAGVTTISDCVFYGNEATYRAGGLMIDHTEGLITGCVFYDNLSSGIGGGAIQGNSSTVTVSNCTIVDNTAVVGGSGVHFASTSGSINNTILAYNTGASVLWGVGTTVHNLSYGNEGEGDLGNGDMNIYLDPRFCDPLGFDLTLQANSACLPGSPDNPWGEHIGALDTGCAPPATSSESWGGVKALYR